MIRAKHWRVDVYIDEHDGRTRAEARLRPRDMVTMIGLGRARLSPVDTDVPEVGDEIAVARALTDLGRRLMTTAQADGGDGVDEADGAEWTDGADDRAAVRTSGGPAHASEER